MSELIELTVGEVAHGGWCVARAGNDPAGHVVFVRHALPGERVRARITARTARFARADAVDILDASPDRVQPPCPFAGPGMCGGCDWQHAAPSAQRGIKAAVVGQQLRRIAGIDHVVKVEPLPGDDGGLGWRTRVTYAVGDDGLAGLRKHRSHEIVPVTECPIAHPAVNDLGVPRRRWHGAAAVQAVTTTTGERAVIVTDGGGPGGRQARQRGKRLARSASRYGSASSPGGDRPERPQAARHAATGHGNLAKVAADIGAQAGAAVLRSRAAGHFELIHGRPWLHERAAGRDWRLHPGTFWQVHPGAADALAAAVMSALAPASGDGVLDLYSGAGLFSGVLAAAVRPGGWVSAVEASQSAVRDARRNLRDLPEVRIRRGRVGDVLAAGSADPAAVAGLAVLDPPRAGAGAEVSQRLARPGPGMSLRRVAYVSCDPATLARDLAVFLRYGWRLDALRGFDAFPMTHHVECVATLVRA